MPVVRIDFDTKNVTKKEITALATALRTIVIDATGIEHVHVYATSPDVAVNINPIEAYVYMSAHKVKDEDTLFADIKSAYLAWKKKKRFKHSITLTLQPMEWKFEVGI